MEERLKPGKLLKAHMIEQIAQHLKDSSNLFIAECSRLTNKEVQDLRARLKKASANFLVVKNSMCLRALDKIKPFNLDAVKGLIKGTCGLGYSSKDPIVVSKILVDFTKENDKLKLKGACVDGEAISLNAIKELASIPSREVLLTKLVSSLNSPIYGIVSVCAGALRQFVYALNAMKDKREKEKEGGN